MGNEIFQREWNWIEQLSAAFHIFAANIKSVLKVMLIVFLPISILETVISGRMWNAYTVFQHFCQQLAATGLTASNEAAFLQSVYQVLLHSGLLFMVALFLQPVGTITIAKVVKQFLAQGEISFGTALGEAFSLMPTIVGTGVIYGVLIFFSGLVIVPYFYFSVAWGLYLYAIGLSGQKGRNALRYSKGLVKGKWWRTLGYAFLLGIIAMLWNSAFQLVYSLLPNTGVSDVVYQFLCYFSAAFVVVGQTLLFLNREAVTYGAPAAERKENEEKEEKEEE